MVGSSRRIRAASQLYALDDADEEDVNTVTNGLLEGDMARWSLKFRSPGLEHAYSQFYVATTIGRLRHICSFFALSAAVVIMKNVYEFPNLTSEQFSELNAPLIGVVALVIFLWLSTFIRALRVARFLQFSIFLGALGVNAATLFYETLKPKFFDPASCGPNLECLTFAEINSGMLAAALIGLPTVGRMSTPFAGLLGLCSTVGCAAVSLAPGSVGRRWALSNVLFVCAAAALGLYISHTTQRSHRRFFHLHCALQYENRVIRKKLVAARQPAEARRDEDGIHLQSPVEVVVRLIRSNLQKYGSTISDEDAAELETWAQNLAKMGREILIPSLQEQLERQDVHQDVKAWLANTVGTRAGRAGTTATANGRSGSGASFRTVGSARHLISRDSGTGGTPGSRRPGGSGRGVGRMTASPGFDQPGVISAGKTGEEDAVCGDGDGDGASDSPTPSGGGGGGGGDGDGGGGGKGGGRVRMQRWSAQDEYSDFSDLDDGDDSAFSDAGVQSTFRRTLPRLSDLPPMRAVPGVRSSALSDLPVSVFGLSAGSPVPMRETLQSAVESTKWCWPVFRYAQQTDRPLSVMLSYMFHEHRCPVSFRMLQSTLTAAANAIEAAYLPKPYHNSLHAASVVYDMHWMMVRGGLSQVLSELHTMAALFAAAIHDVGHPALSNAHLVATGHPLAITYSDDSVLERYHLATGFRLVSTDDRDILRHLTIEERASFRTLVIEMVLATDLKHHFEELHSLKATILAGGVAADPNSPSASHPGQLWRDSSPGAGSDSADTTCGGGGGGASIERLEVTRHKRRLNLQQLFGGNPSMALRFAIKLADVSHVSKSQEAHLKWTSLLTQEFMAQGDAERAAGLPVQPYMDREKAESDGAVLCRSQLGFLDYICKPLFNTATALLEHSDEFIVTLDQNYRHWKQRLEECSDGDSDGDGDGDGDAAAAADGAH